MAFDNSLLRTSEFPTIWCPGCGHGIVAQAAIRACGDMGWDRDEVYAVSGIGCSARTPAYMDFNSVQTTHGRAIAFATGMKMFRPEKHVFLMLGDGDCCSIGGNHFIHACKRNIDLTVIVLNNMIYGMTGGQVSPTTPHDSRTTTTAYGNIDEPLDICKLAMAAGASFVARTTAYHAQQIPGLIKEGFANKGFSVIEILCPCPTGYGARNGFKVVGEMYDRLKSMSIPIEKAKTMSPEEMKGKVVIGTFKNEPREEYIEKYFTMIKGISSVETLNDLTSRPYSTSGKMLGRREFRLSGTGGQGLLLSGIILSEAMIRQGKNAVHTQSYGVEARGGASRSEVVISDDDISFPEVSCPDVLLAMSQASYDKFGASVKVGGAILTDSTFVKAKALNDAKCYEYPITEYAKDTLGEIRAANIVALGLLAGLNDFISKDAMMDSILARLPAKAHELNQKAFNHGYEQGLAMITAK
jgi:2-oxoglutarate ferredoxin oxidoreductase subunit beta